MPNINTSHQGTLRGTVMLPVEAESDGELGYKTALSEMEGDEPSDTGKPSRARPQDDVEIEEVSEGSDGEEAEQPPRPREGGGLRKKTAKDSPAYVAPIGNIPKIPSIEPIRSNPHPTPPPEDGTASPRKPPVHQTPKEHLVGHTIDEFGDIVDDNGDVLGRVEGDLPSMIGRAISNARGDVLGDDGELLGYVAEVGAGEGDEKPAKQEVPTWSLADIMKTMAAAGKGPGGLRVDPFGNILDPEGSVVGSFHDNMSGFGKKSGAPNGSPLPNGAAEKQSRPREQGPQETPRQDEAGDEAGASSQSKPRENAQSHRKEDPKESPSDIFRIQQRGPTGPA